MSRLEAQVLTSPGREEAGTERSAWAGMDVDALNCGLEER